MPTQSFSGKILERLDQFNEFERVPIAPDKLKPGRYFAAMFTGEHIAATEFVIGALFVSFGAGAFDVLVGLLLGNLMAVLSWAFVCAPIAVQTRLTLYWYLRKIAGPGVMAIYNMLNAILHCILGGAMITVSASAVRLIFSIPEQTKWYPDDYRFVLLVLGVGAVVVTLAILGFAKLSQFSAVCSPWMTVMFIVGGLSMLPLLGRVESFSDFWRIANQKIWTGHAPPGSSSLSFWHVAMFAWICNQATHLGLTDMAIFRYARRSSYGFYSAFGMYLGHYLSWICAGILGATAAAFLGRPLIELDSGNIAYTCLGAMGALTVVIAGWTTANPTLYRAGLALQVVTPGWPRWLVTFIVGVITTVIACFPFVFTKLLDFVGIYGLLLMPIGAIVVVEHWLFPRLGWNRFWAARRGLLFNMPALIAWWGSLLIALGIWEMGWMHLFFLPIPVWFLTAGFYIILSALSGARRPLPPLAEDPPATSPATAPVAVFWMSKTQKTAYYFFGIVALLSLLTMLALAGCVFKGLVEIDDLKRYLILATAIYYLTSIPWLYYREKLHPV
jgi:NCS1 family nucleobase:cation symporter-1